MRASVSITGCWLADNVLCAIHSLLSSGTSYVSAAYTLYPLFHHHFYTARRAASEGM